ncbi:uncharacterized protein AKAW2_20061S [Aspergillus luchuensis]|uniref:Similar to An13g01540 n=1 Tax=Aspergillus kawachii TaxID=1069201 RepID=A0A146F267_ASPKA|nr:uncharacterized protein AKAW2_20061S [Aspergillus luchuensis]BCR95121.1 hypothetical protein AKAW2_20061S [Aspergillus luchuensis]BCS07688.1 hypothetical protein ALUC_20058S [Aspergillus luchuensis]GAA89714.1 similar to An13g01540 [Aspergillus luchuensis IFO 4308]GAT20384.1 similar to An13g01540 [Aspergillus luchuensis]
MDPPTQPPTHAISINIYGRGDATLGDGPSHMGIAVYEIGASTCQMHHIRNPTDEYFIYDPRVQPLQDDPVLRGRCELITFRQEECQHVNSLLSAFGNDASNIPEFGVGNCQDWVAGAVAMLEDAGVLASGEGAFWKSMINEGAESMKRACGDSGRKWIDGPEVVFEGEPDARFKDEGAKKKIGKLKDNEAFRERMQTLMGKKSSGGVGGGEAGERNVPERPFYVSSPFFSQTNRRG